MRNLIVILVILSFVNVSSYAQNTCYGYLKRDTLALGNGLVERKFVWNGGNLMTFSLTDKQSGRVHISASQSPDFAIMKDVGKGVDGTFSTVVPASDTPFKVIVTYGIGGLYIRREFRIYEDCPVIATDTYLRGCISAVPSSAVLDRLDFGGRHWHVRAVEFFDATDSNNNLVSERDFISFTKNSCRGNLLFLENGEDGSGVFFLKEAPCCEAQIEYSGKDFSTSFGTFTVTGLGVSEDDISSDDWTKAYSCVVGVYDGGELSALKALQGYQKNIRNRIAGRDEMIMMNTWGDRSQDAKVNEAFCLAELERASRLGLTHFQIDDGWQSGKSPNSVVAGGSFKNIWENSDYWTPDPVKYPDGLSPIVSKASELGIEVGLWFNPSVQNDFEDWEKDAQAVISLYREYGIKIYKIDGLSIPTKRAETNLRRFFDKVTEETRGDIIFNLDVTAGRRGGYYMFNEYGNIFLENRYTDWRNYYPYQTLRNLWQLSKYVPAQNLQIEFLNKWRNADLYYGDLFSPANYPFEYLFATTMVGQPLAWMEASNLPEEAFGLRALVDAYKEMRYDFHKGLILPVGDEPSGRSWTGFQSIVRDKSGYFLIFREDNDAQEGYVETWLDAGDVLELTPMFGSGEGFQCTTGRNGAIRFSLERKNDFVMYRYQIQ